MTSKEITGKLFMPDAHRPASPQSVAPIDTPPTPFSPKPEFIVTDDMLEGKDEREKSIFAAWDAFKKKYREPITRGIIPEEVLRESQRKIYRIAKEKTILEEAERENPITSAFLIHTRHIGNPDLEENEREELNDARRVLAILDPKKYGIEYEDIDTLWDALGAFEVGRVSGIIDNATVEVSLISVPVLPSRLKEIRDRNKGSRSGAFRESMHYVAPHVAEAADLAHKFASQKKNDNHKEPIIIGLGEMLASLTRQGHTLEDKFKKQGIRVETAATILASNNPESTSVEQDNNPKSELEQQRSVRFVTGHNVTTAGIVEHINAIATEIGKPLNKLRLALIGATGSICRSVTDYMCAAEVDGLTFVDLDKNILEDRAKKLQDAYPHLEDKIDTFTGNEHIPEACKKADVIVTAASQPQPFLGDKEFGTSGESSIHVIDDGQPPNVHKGVKKSRWPTLKLPDGFKRNFDYGIKGEWGCLVEVILTHTRAGRLIQTTGSTDVQRIDQTLLAMRQFGITAAPAESWGQLIDPPTITSVAA